MAAMRRSRLLDIGASALILAILGGISFAILFTNRRRIDEENLRVVNGICLCVSIALLVLGGAPLFYFWRKDRSVDKVYFSTATARELRNIMLLMVTVAFGCIALLAAEIVELIARVRGRWGWEIGFNIVVILLICWVTQTVVQGAFMAKDAAKDTRQQENGTQIPAGSEVKPNDPSELI